MDNGSDPTGMNYIRTYRALFQLAEIILGLLAWCLIAAGPYRRYSAMQYALGSHVSAWLITLIFFNIYICGIHGRVNKFFSARSAASTQEGGESTAGSLAPASGSSTPQVRWFVVEYVLYFVLSILIFVASICVTANLFGHAVWFAACGFSWLLTVIIEFHYCLLFRNVESVWPHEWLIGRFKKSGASSKGESEKLVPSSTSQP